MFLFMYVSFQSEFFFGVIVGVYYIVFTTHIQSYRIIAKRIRLRKEAVAVKEQDKNVPVEHTQKKAKKLKKS